MSFVVLVWGAWALVCSFNLFFLIFAQFFGTWALQSLFPRLTFDSITYDHYRTLFLPVSLSLPDTVCFSLHAGDL